MTVMHAGFAPAAPKSDNLGTAEPGDAYVNIVHNVHRDGNENNITTIEVMNGYEPLHGSTFPAESQAGIINTIRQALRDMGIVVSEVRFTGPHGLMVKWHKMGAFDTIKVVQSRVLEIVSGITGRTYFARNTCSTILSL